MYISGRAEEVTGPDVETAVQVYSRGSQLRGAREWTLEHVTAPAPLRLYRATASAWSVLDSVGHSGSGDRANTGRSVLEMRDSRPELDFEPWGEDADLVELLGERGAAGFRALFEAFPEAVGILWPIRDSGREDRRLQVRLRQHLDAADVPAARGHGRALHAAGGASADARQPRLRCVRAGVRNRGAVGRGDHLRHALRRRVHARDLRAARREARQGADGLPHRRDRRAPDGERAARLRRRRGPRPA